MQETMIEGIACYPASYFAEKWGLKLATIKDYVKPSVGKIRNAKRIDGELYLPANTVRPLTDALRQRILWAIVMVKDRPRREVDLTQEGIDINQLNEVLDSLRKSGHIDYREDGNDNSGDKVFSCWITERGYELIRYKKEIKDRAFNFEISPETLQAAFTGTQLLAQLLSLIIG